MFRMMSLISMVFITLATTACAAGPGNDVTKDDTGSAVVARVGDAEITAGDLEADAGPTLMKLRQQMYDAKMQVLDAKIFDELVAQAAAKAGMTTDEWLAKNLVVPEPDEAQIEQVMKQYRSRLAKDDEQARKQVVDYLKQQGRQQARTDLQRRLKAETGVEVFLEPPRVEPVIEAYNPTRGPVDAPVTLVEYTDFQCPYCGRAQETLEQIHERYGDSVRFVFKNLPLAMHQQSRFAAQAALCAGDQGAFWPLHDWLFANHTAINREAVTEQVEGLGLDLDEFNACIDEGRHLSEIDADSKEANSFGITGTPGFVINGRLITGAQPLENFVTIIDDELRRAGKPVPEPPAKAETTTEAKDEAAAE